MYHGYILKNIKINVSYVVMKLVKKKMVLRALRRKEEQLRREEVLKKEGGNVKQEGVNFINFKRYI